MWLIFIISFNPNILSGRPYWWGQSGIELVSNLPKVTHYYGEREPRNVDSRATALNTQLFIFDKTTYLHHENMKSPAAFKLQDARCLEDLFCLSQLTAYSRNVNRLRGLNKHLGKLGTSQPRKQRGREAKWQPTLTHNSTPRRDLRSALKALPTHISHSKLLLKPYPAVHPNTEAHFADMNFNSIHMRTILHFNRDMLCAKAMVKPRWTS